MLTGIFASVVTETTILLYRKKYKIIENENKMYLFSQSVCSTFPSLSGNHLLSNARTSKFGADLLIFKYTSINYKFDDCDYYCNGNKLHTHTHTSNYEPNDKNTK